LNYLSLLLLLWLITLNSVAAERGESIMFQPKDHPFVEAPQANDDKAAKCAQMVKQIEALKGKPQRRKAALERYRLMCIDMTEQE
jgi:hypothetical protein